MSLIAAYTGICQECSGEIDEGDLITGALDGYVHLDCSDDDPDEWGPYTLCPDCFLTTPCFCGDGQ